MSRERFNPSTGKWEPVVSKTDEQRKPASAYVHTDEIAPMQSMINGRYFTSKSAYERHVRENGYVVVGNEKNFQYRPDPSDERRYVERLEEDAAQSYYDLRDGNAELDELTRERCKVIDRNIERYSHDRRERDPHTGRVLDDE